MQPGNTITLDFLNELIDREPNDTKRHQVADLFIQALNDWPDNAETIEDYLMQLKAFAKTNTLDIPTLNTVLKQLHPANDAWRMESISDIINVFELSGHDNIDIILEELHAQS